MNHVSIKMTAVNFMNKNIYFKFPNELYTFSNLAHVGIKMAAANFIPSLLFPKCLYTFSNLAHVGIAVIAVHLYKLLCKLLLAFIHFRSGL